MLRMTTIGMLSQFLGRGCNAIALCVLIGTVLCACLTACRDSGSSPGSSAESVAAAESGGHEGHDHGEEAHVDEVTLTRDAIDRYGIKIETASLYRLGPSFVAPARVAFNAEAIAHVGSTLPGRVVELAVRLGDVVTKGDLLLVVESPQLGEAQSDYLQKLIAAQTTTATVDLAKNALDRAQRLYDENRGIALDEVQKREGEFKVAQASLRTAESTAVAAENKLHVLGMTQETVAAIKASGEVNPRFPIVAPISGEVVEREVTLGELVNPEREKLLVLANVEILWVLADVPEAHLPELAQGAKAWINAGSLDPHQHEGQISYVAPMIDPHTRTVSVRVAVECEDRSLKPGMFVQVEIASTTVTIQILPPLWRCRTSRSKPSKAKRPCSFLSRAKRTPLQSAPSQSERPWPAWFRYTAAWSKVKRTSHPGAFC